MPERPQHRFLVHQEIDCEDVTDHPVHNTASDGAAGIQNLVEVLRHAVRNAPDKTVNLRNHLIQIQVDCLRAGASADASNQRLKAFGIGFQIVEEPFDAGKQLRNQRNK